METKTNKSQTWEHIIQINTLSKVPQRRRKETSPTGTQNRSILMKQEERRGDTSKKQKSRTKKGTF